MKNLGKIILVTLLVMVCVSFSDKIDFDDLACSKELTNVTDLKDGDIIFHTSTSSQSNMLKIATASRLTHVGVIFIRNNKPYVFEAVQPVKITPLDEFIARGVDSKYKIMRYDQPLSKAQINKGLLYSRKQLGKKYDIRFQWSNDKMYCSELVWKVYKEMGVELCPTKKFSDFNINNIIVRSVIERRFKGVKFDENETVVAPTNIAESYELTTIFDTY